MTTTNTVRFSKESIDRAIVMTQYDLRGFAHPLGFRLKYMVSPKYLDATTCNLLEFAAGGEPNSGGTDVDYFTCTYEEYLACCREFAGNCEASRKEAIQLIIHEIVRQNRQMRQEVAAGKRKPSPYLQTLSTDNYWGRAVLALAEAFDVGLKREKIVKKKNG
ncbi:hypothetical protein KBC70_02310 [Candidatus Woesebacteria bacterium]|nr:hypothetical protein [Candidatus Woesebacteria bacterium]